MKTAATPAFLFILLLAIPALAVIPQFWEVRTYEDLREGDLDGLSITGDGDLVLSPLFEELYDTGEPLVFSAASDSEGNIYLGTGHQGRVFRIDGEGAGSLLADFGELDVLAVAVGPDDTLLAATSPDGSVYRVSPDGRTEVLFDPEDLYIWDMIFDADGRLLVATGEEGVVYRVGMDGSAEVFYDSENTHILSMAVDPEGGVIAGGDPKGYLYRIPDDGRAFVIYDSGMREVRSIALAPDGRIFAVVLDSPGAPSAAPSAPLSAAPQAGSAAVTLPQGPLAAVSQNGIQAADVDEAAPGGGGIGGGSGRGPGTGTPRSRILEILPDGAVSTVWESNSEMIFSVLYFGDRLFFSSGTRGRVYALGTERRPTLMVESTEEQTTRLLEAGGRLFAASSNRGKLWELGDSAESSGTYESGIRDTGAISTWGKLSWVGRAARLSTRSGNTGSPDSTWSDWVPPGPAGDVTSPPARFIQWQAVLDGAGGEDPVLSSVTLPYLQQNFRPDVTSIEILHPGLALRQQQGAGNPAAVERRGISGRVVPATPRPPSRTAVESGAQALRWTARDQNDDVLGYSIFYRADNEGGWKLLASGIEDTFYTIEPNTLPDGMYVLRLVASDIGSNPPERALSGEILSAPFAVDHTPPAVTMIAGVPEGTSVTLEATAVDRTSVLKQPEMSVDSGPWRPVFPVDGIVDSLAEDFRFSSGPLGPGEHVVTFRIYDQNENVGIGKATVRIP